MYAFGKGLMLYVSGARPTREAVATGPEATVHAEGQQSEANQELSRSQKKK